MRHFFSFKKFLTSHCHRESDEFSGKLPLQVFQMEGLKAFGGRIIKTSFSCLSIETFLQLSNTLSNLSEKRFRKTKVPP